MFAKQGARGSKNKLQENLESVLLNENETYQNM